MKYYIGIDPGTQCGWAVLDENGNRLASGTWDLSSRRHEGGGMRYVRLQSHLRELFDAYHPAVVFYEEVRRHLGTDAAHVYGGIVSHIAAFCEGRTTPYSGIPVGTVKKYATGKGNAQKDAMIAATVARWPDWRGDDNEADAIWVALAGLKSIS